MKIKPNHGYSCEIVDKVDLYVRIILKRGSIHINMLKSLVSEKVFSRYHSFF